VPENREVVKRERDSLTPAFRAFLRELEGPFGKPRRVSAHDVEMWAFAAPELAKTGAWSAKARKVGGAACAFHAGETRELRVATGSVARLTALFSTRLYEPRQVTRDIEGLDHAAGVSFDWICDDGSFQLRLLRPFSRLDVFAKAFGDTFGKPRAIHAALRKRVWRQDPLPEHVKATGAARARPPKGRRT
jgi:hypothetical protein